MSKCRKKKRIQDTIFQFQGRDLISGISIKYYQNTLNYRTIYSIRYMWLEIQRNFQLNIEKKTRVIITPNPYFQFRPINIGIHIYITYNRTSIIFQ